MKRILSILFCIVIMAQISMPVYSMTDLSEHITINGKEVSFIRTVYEKDGVYILPFKELMAKMGFFVSYDKEQEAYTGTVNGADVFVASGQLRAQYDQVWIELNTPTVGLSDDVLIESDFVERIYGISCVYSDGNIAFTVEKLEEDDNGKNDEFDADAYLAGITPKNTTVTNNDLFKGQISNAELIAMREVEVNDAPGFTRALEIENLTEPALYYRSQVTVPTSESISAGDVLVVTFYARKIMCVDESGFAKMNTCMEMLDTDWTKFHNVTEDVPEVWTKYRYVFTAKKDANAGGAQLGFRIGFRYQTIQVGALEILNYGKKADISLIAPEKVVKTTYYGREDGALWREEAFKRIEKYRKNDMKIHVVDEDGNPVPDAKVSANMTKSEFLWGTAVTEKRAFNTRRTSLVYDNILANEFNSITLESNMKPTAFRIRNCVYGINFARENNMHFRAHAVLWDALRYFPSDEVTEDSTVEDVYDFCLRYASKLIYNFGDSFDEMDVVNEPLNNSYFRDKYGTDFIADLYKAVHDMAPDVKLFMNETGIVGNDSNWAAAERLKTIIDDIVAKGAPLQGVGVQNHSAGMIYPQVLYNQLDYIAENLDYIAVTEYDYLSNLSDNIMALETEADYLRDSIIMAYSHPKMTSFTMWGFGDLGHWRLNAPLYFETYTAKPALDYWNQYVWGEWFTQEETTTDENGYAVIRGHRGDYDITVNVDGKSAKTTLVLTKDGENSVNAVVKSDGIELQSSEEAEKPLPKISMIKSVFEEKESEYLYEKLYENKVSDITKNDGSNVGFLADKDNKSVSALGREDFVNVKLEEVMNYGCIAVNTADGKDNVLRIEGLSENGEWINIYAGESQNGKLTVSFDDMKISEIRITPLTDTTLVLDSINVSLREDRRL